MTLAIQSVLQFFRATASTQRGTPVGEAKQAIAMAMDSLKLGKRNDAVARMFIKLGTDAVDQEKWESVGSAMRKAVDSAATQGVSLDAFDAIGTALRSAARARKALEPIYSDYEREQARKLDALKPVLEASQAAAIELACTFATTSEQALVVVERTFGHSKATTEIAFTRAIALGTTVGELIAVANVACDRDFRKSAEQSFEKAIAVGKTVDELLEIATITSEKGFRTLAEKATDKALELAGNTPESALRIASFASEKGFRGLAERAVEKASALQK